MNVFSNKLTGYIFTEDIIAVCNKVISQNIICVYIRHLYKDVQQQNILDRVRFADPNLIGHLIDSTEKREVMGRSYHWILFVVDPHGEKVYMLDPFIDPEHAGPWRAIMQIAIRMFNFSLHKRGSSTYFVGTDRLYGRYYWQLVIMCPYPNKKSEIKKKEKMGSNGRNIKIMAKSINMRDIVEVLEDDDMARLKMGVLR